MTALAFKKECLRFADMAAPYLHITDEQHYEETIGLIEELLDQVEDKLGDPVSGVITLLAGAIEEYEDQDPELLDFENRAMGQDTGLALLRVLMDQHRLGTADLPEIGSKSMVSRVLSGDRDLSKKHIQALSERFHISPGMFF
ncbi:MAG: transcriptional regulator [Sedimenticola sp.]